MKKLDTPLALEAIKSVQFNKITDKTVQTALLDDALALARDDRETQQRIKDAQELLLGKFAEEGREVDDLRTRLLNATDPKEREALYNKFSAHVDYFAAQRGFLKKKDEILDEEVDGLTRVDREKFQEAVADIEITLGQISAMQPLFDLPYTNVKPKK